MGTVIDCIIQSHFHQRYRLQATQPMFMPKCLYNLLNGAVMPFRLTISLQVESQGKDCFAT